MSDEHGTTEASWLDVEMGPADAKVGIAVAAACNCRKRSDVATPLMSHEDLLEDLIVAKVALQQLLGDHDWSIDTSLARCNIHMRQSKISAHV